MLTAEGAGQVTTGKSFTVMTNVQEPVLVVYVMVCGPGPAVLGMYTPAFTPLPTPVPL